MIEQNQKSVVDWVSGFYQKRNRNNKINTNTIRLFIK